MPRNPADIQRKLERKKELQRNKRQREMSREVAQMRKDPAKMREELLRLEQLERAGRLDNAMRPVKARLAEAYRQQLARQQTLAAKAAPATATAAAATSDSRVAPAPPALPPRSIVHHHQQPKPAVPPPPPAAVRPRPADVDDDGEDRLPIEAVVSSGLIPTVLRVKRQRTLSETRPAVAPSAPVSTTTTISTAKPEDDHDKEMETFLANMRELGAV